MKYWYDTEFHDDGKTIDLISIGIVAEDNREFYAVSADFDQHKLSENPWLVENVWPSLPVFRHPKSSRCACGIGHIDREHPAVRPRAQIARAVEEFLTVGLYNGAVAQLWSWYESYDHVALAQLFGTMMQLPAGIPKRTNDIEQEAERLDIVGLLPEQPKGQHNALIDARYHRQLWTFVDGFARDRAKA